MSDLGPETPRTIGPYPVERELGRGGMGVVYLARDPKLGRQVAIKVLPAAFTQDEMRLQRFEREARTLAAVSHRNVGMIFGLETDEQNQRLLVLEFIPGVSLTQKLQRGGLALDESLRMNIQIAEGLEAAHELGIVHRDLKPDNVRVTPEGIVKILDFGLASPASLGGGGGAFASSEAGTAMGSGLTVQGMVMGTPGYMSPEQARGLPTDRRSDIWAFGCVLFECLSGYKAFGGETVSDAIAAILEREPDFTLLPARTPNRVREVLRRCFIKDPRRRMRDIGDVRIELEDVLAQPQSGWYRAGESGAGARPRALARLMLPMNQGGGGVGASASDLVLANTMRSAIAVAPDGSGVAFVGGVAPSTQLYVRRMDAHEARVVPGTNGAEAPFFSPEGTRLGFFRGGKLQRVALSGGAPVTLASAPRPSGGTWCDGDTIIFAPEWNRGLFRVSVAGDSTPPEPVAEPDLAGGELALLGPEMLPGGKHVLVTVWTGTSFEDALISAIDLRTKARRPLIHGGCNPRYLSSGHIVFSRGGSLLAVGFDPEALEVFGQPMPVQDGVLGNALGGAAHFGVGGDGTLVYASGAVWEPGAELMSINRSNETTSITSESRAFVAPVLSPDGSRLAVQVQGASDHLWVYDLNRPGPGVRVTFHADNSCPVWSPDGTMLAFRSNMTGRSELFQMAIGAGGAAGAPEPVFADPERVATPMTYAELPGVGRVLLFTLARAEPKTGTDICMVRVPTPMNAGGNASGNMGTDSTAQVVVQSPASAWGATVSPDSKLIAYVSDESGRAEVYVQQFQGAGAMGSVGSVGARRQVSVDGGLAPLFARSGGELYFRQGAQIIAVRVAIEPTFMVGRPRVVAEGEFAAPTNLRRNYDVFPDGQRFVVLKSKADSTRVTTLNVVLNWFEELRRRVAPPPSVERGATTMGGGGGASQLSSRGGMSVGGVVGSYASGQMTRGSEARTATTPPPSPMPMRPAPAINTQMPTQMPSRPPSSPPAYPSGGAGGVDHNSPTIG